MFRTKVAVSLFLVFVAAGTVIHLNVSEQIYTRARSQLEQRLQVARNNVERNRRLVDFAILAKAEQVAAWPQMAEVLSRPIERFADEEGTLPPAEEYAYQIHRLMNEEVMVWKAKFEALHDGRVEQNSTLADFRKEQPDLFAILDARGIGVAKSDDPAWYGPDEANLAKEFPALKTVIQDKRPISDVWLVKGAPMNVAAVPVKSGDTLLGAVVLGYRLTDAEAKRDKALVAADIAYFVGDRLAQSSTLDTTRERAVQKIVAERKLYEGPFDRQPVTFDLNTHTQLAYVGNMSGNESAKGAGFLVMGDLDEALAQAGSELFWIPLACGLGYLLALGLVLFFYERLMAPFEEIDRGVLEIINTEENVPDYWFDVKGHGLPNTLSQNLNIMVCQLSGRPLPEEFEEQIRHQDPADAAI